MSTILSRIKELSINEGITIGYLEKKIGASKGVLSRAIQHGSDIQAKWLQIIVENYPNYSSSWLLTGKGEMIISETISEPNSLWSWKEDCLDNSTYKRGYNSTKECSECEKKEERIADLLETISSLKEANAVQKELISELKK